MIRVLALCLLALPASAQSFHGLTPGMDIFALETLGEAYGPPDEISDGLFEVYFENGDASLFVRYRDGYFVEMTATTPPSSEAAPGASYPVTLADAVRVAGSEGWYIEEQGQADTFFLGTRWEMYHNLASDPDVIVHIQFRSPAPVDPPEMGADGFTILDPDARLRFVVLYTEDRLREVMAEVGLTGMTRVDRPGAAAFATPLSEAFPSPILP